MAIDTSLIMLLCAGAIYFSFKKISKKRWKIITFIGVWFAGFVLVVMAGAYASVMLHNNDYSVLQRYLGSSLLTPLAGCLLGMVAIKLANKNKNSDG